MKLRQRTVSDGSNTAVSLKQGYIAIAPRAEGVAQAAGAITPPVSGRKSTCGKSRCRGPLAVLAHDQEVSAAGGIVRHGPKEVIVPEPVGDR